MVGHNALQSISACLQPTLSSLPSSQARAVSSPSSVCKTDDMLRASASSFSGGGGGARARAECSTGEIQIISVVAQRLFARRIYDALEDAIDAVDAASVDVDVIFYAYVVRHQAPACPLPAYYTPNKSEYTSSLSGWALRTQALRMSSFTNRTARTYHR